MAAASRRAPASLVLYGGVGVRSAEVERRFFDRLRMPNGTWKTTWERRLDDLNAALLPLLPRDRPVRLMDVAVSSGVSTGEWSEQLAGAGIAHTIVAGDLCVEGWLTSVGTRFAVVFDRERQPLLVEWGRVALPIQSERPFAALVRPLVVPVLRALARLGARVGAAAPSAPAVPHRLVHRRIPLVVPELAARPQVTVVTDDLLAPAPLAEPFDAVRAANILHRAYFDDATLVRMVATLRGRLRDGGLLAVCRTHEDGRNDATIFRLEAGAFAAVGSLGAGTEIESLVLGAR